MSGPIPSSGALYRPADVARMLGCSEWWVKDQARKRLIPYTRPGGKYGFTDEHVAEIIRRYEVRPLDTGPTPPAQRKPKEGPSNMDSEKHGLRLVARPPRRARASTPDSEAA